MNIAEAEEAALKAQLKAAETTIHKLKDEAARTKKLVADTRAACANEVRKRDRQIEGLKKAVTDAGRARGERKSTGMTTIHVVGEVGADEAMVGTASTADEGYSLRQETNGFLAHLAKGLSEENETLLSLIRKTNDSLKDMSGWDKNEGAAAIGDGHAVALPANPEDMATDIENVLGHLRTMLTNPSFVPLEEVVVREEEIFRLRDGWEKMETRWQEAVHLIDGWRRRMAANGRPVNMEELKMGLRLSPVRVKHVEETVQREPFGLSTLQEEEEEQSSFVKQPLSPSPAASLHLVPATEYEDMAPEYNDGQNDLDGSDESSIFEDDVDIDMDELQEPEPNVEILQVSTAYSAEDSTSMVLPPPPKLTPLEETNLARNRTQSGLGTEKSRKRSGNLLEDDSNETAEAPPPPPHGPRLGQSAQKRLKVSSDAENEKPSSRSNSDIYTNSNSSLDSILLAKPSPESTTSKTSSKTTAKSTRSDAVSKEAATPLPAKPTVRTTRAVAQQKRDTPSKPLTRTRSARATAATTSSAARTAPSKSEPSRSRPAPSSTTAADMPPPPRPARNKITSPANQPTPPARSEHKSPPVETQLPPPYPALSTDVSETTAASTTNTTAVTKRAPDSPIRSPTKSASRLPLPRNAGALPPAQQSPVTVASIAAKLAASERDANAARVRAKLKAARLAKTGATDTASASTSTAASSVRVVSGDPIKRVVRDASGSSAGASDRLSASESGNGSLSLDENGTVGGVSILRAESSSAASSVGNADDGDGQGRDGGKTIMLSPQRRRDRDRKSEREAAAAPPPPPTPAAAAAATPRRGGAGASPAKEGKRKREVRSRAERVASRRRSTLSPWELQSLIAGEVVPPTPKVPEGVQQ